MKKLRVGITPGEITIGMSILQEESKDEGDSTRTRSEVESLAESWLHVGVAACRIRKICGGFRKDHCLRSAPISPSCSITGKCGN